MKDKFSEFYYKPNLDKLWNDCIFVFDTNVLINLYYEKNVYFKFIEILENKIKNRIWMPYQVGLEYHNHRFDAVKNKEKIYFNLIGSYNGIAKSIDTVIIKLSKENHFMDLPKYMDLDEIKEQLDKLNEIIETINQKVDQNPDFLYDDEVRNKLDELYSGKIGDNYPENRLQEIYDMGKIRYSQKIPPGFKDKKYGDLVIWFQMMEYAKHQNLPIIFITDDSKEDWWLRPESTGGPHPALIKEFTTSTNQDFFIYTLSEFLKNAKEYLNVDVDPETIDTAKEIQVISEDVQGIENEITSSSLAKSYLKYLKPTNNLISTTVSDPYMDFLVPNLISTALVESFLKKREEDQAISSALVGSYLKNSENQLFKNLNKNSNNELDQNKTKKDSKLKRKSRDEEDNS